MNIDQNIVLLIVAALNAVTAFLAWRTSRTADSTKLVVIQTQRDVAIVEKATNSMKDALVKSTGEAKFAAGKDEGRIEGEMKAAALAEGKLESNK